jgi:hypothetical protein
MRFWRAVRIFREEASDLRKQGEELCADRKSRRNSLPEVEIWGDIKWANPHRSKSWNAVGGMTPYQAHQAHTVMGRRSA